ncbi:hypothetical protein DAEQUDRAFT_747486 [Daedalea quercina L-15889]|uniref:Protein kinase domain-containing protein n=1 Tax=Daedalea quercina L-15889 TaxID=1314783 RepID=A0A165LG50_9APHY|nr:hypothetical protein DAEQUDRAFT_747486 [Daedalea quercina L-15889]
MHAEDLRLTSARKNGVGATKTRKRAIAGRHDSTCGSNVVIRVIIVGDDGRRHLDILRKLARGTKSLMTENHVARLWNEASLDDIVFAISPYIGNSLEDCYRFWPNSSVGETIDMIIQAFEAIVFVHDLGIDLCQSNCLVQWHPESLSTMRVPLSRPRVFLTDFETAYEFPPGLAQEQRTLCGLPYDPFKADVWQLAEVPELDAVLELVYTPDVSARLSAMEARDKLAAVVDDTASIALLIPP